jgi:hypothetical protein
MSGASLIETSKISAFSLDRTFARNRSIGSSKAILALPRISKYDSSLFLRYVAFDADEPSGIFWIARPIASLTTDSDVPNASIASDFRRNAP